MSQKEGVSSSDTFVEGSSSYVTTEGDRRKYGETPQDGIWTRPGSDGYRSQSGPRRGGRNANRGSGRPPMGGYSGYGYDVPAFEGSSYASHGRYPPYSPPFPPYPAYPGQYPMMGTGTSPIVGSMPGIVPGYPSYPMDGFIPPTEMQGPGFPMPPTEFPLEIQREVSDRYISSPADELISESLKFYFSDENLKKDAYLVSLMDKQGWIEISRILQFNRMKRNNATQEQAVHFLRLNRATEVDPTGQFVRPLSWKTYAVVPADETQTSASSTPTATSSVDTTSVTESGELETQVSSSIDGLSTAMSDMSIAPQVGQPSTPVTQYPGAPQLGGLRYGYGYGSYPAGSAPYGYPQMGMMYPYGDGGYPYMMPPSHPRMPYNPRYQQRKPMGRGRYNAEGTYRTQHHGPSIDPQSIDEKDSHDTTIVSSSVVMVVPSSSQQKPVTQ